MSLRHSTEDLNVCTICREKNTAEGNTLRTACGHSFHRDCLMTWLKRNSTCPQCRAHCSGREFGISQTPNRGARTRSRANTSGNNIVVQPVASSHSQNQSETQQAAPSATTEASVLEGAVGMDDTRIRHIVSAVISARQASVFNDIEERVTRTIEERIESAVINSLNRLNLNLPNEIRTQNNASANHHSHYEWPQDLPRHSGISRDDSGVRRRDSSIFVNAGKIASLINHWDIKFDGSSKLSVENFIYRIESLVLDTLGGNFNILCDNAQCLFEKDARDWFWSFRRSVDRITWPSLCEALRTNFEEYRTDTEIKEDMRNRKQGPNESFGEYKSVIFKMAESLHTPLREEEMVEILQRGLRPRIRQQLLYVPIDSVAQLRKLCLKGESLLSEVSKVNTPFTNYSRNNGNCARRSVNELENNILVTNGCENTDEVKVEELTKRDGEKFNCWNCRKDGHRYMDCMEARSIFCYGCGAAGVYKPTCRNCNPGNFKKSESAHLHFRKDPLMKDQ